MASVGLRVLILRDITIGGTARQHAPYVTIMSYTSNASAVARDEQIFAKSDTRFLNGFSNPGRNANLKEQQKAHTTDIGMSEG